MTGIWSTLTEEQKKAALEYRGPENFGSDELFLMRGTKDGVRDSGGSSWDKLPPDAVYRSDSWKTDTCDGEVDPMLDLQRHRKEIFREFPEMFEVAEYERSNTEINRTQS